MRSGIVFGNIISDGNLVLAPMDGISDQPFRWVCRKLGASITYSEFINASDVPRKLNYITKRACFSNFERPFGFQLYGNDPDEILLAAQLLSEEKPDFFDINFGCSANRVAGRGAGAGLLKEPDLIRKIISKLVSSINFPITAKIRLGWNQENLNYKEIVRIIEDSGAAMIAVHARSKDQNWKDQPNWKAIGEIKNIVKIPVIGNGDVKSQQDIQSLLNETGCDGVMIGRSAIGNPWIFSNEKKASLSKQQIITTIKDHWFQMLAFYGPTRAAIIFKKHLKCYLSCDQFSEIDLRKLISMSNPMKSKLFYE
ncbi:MAG: tRNA-dihydrouridine synthase family protein [Pelolinea sp.]|nr:tRNA-dihydrouridine synthase family protein [Pelolinea sp.]